MGKRYQFKSFLIRIVTVCDRRFLSCGEIVLLRLKELRMMFQGSDNVSIIFCVQPEAEFFARLVRERM